MTRQCMRPGCDRPVAACLTYDTEATAVWLDSPRNDGEPAQHVCSVHATTLTAPLGWTITDRRLVAVAASGAGEAEQAAHVEAESRPEPERESDPDPEPKAEPLVGTAATVQLELETEPGPATAPEPEPPTQAPAAASPTKRSKPKGKLLDRAFEWTGPQHSVLTTGSPEHAEEPEE
ncbi:MAG: DUF3499 family protein [Actinomycetia bacterium]|nr:DUF3499 family protein [Actinomycetes bacterium]